MRLKKSFLSIFSISLLTVALAVGVNNSYADEVLQSPQNVSITTNNAASQAIVSWDAPKNASDFQNLEYVVTESPDGQEFTTTDTTQTFENLSIGQHSFTVKARGTSEDGPIETVIQNFSYTGDQQSFTTPYSGEYKLEVWGAQGGYHEYDKVYGGSGGYSVGTINLSRNENIYVFVGEQGKTGLKSGINNSANASGISFNGGGSGRGFGSGGGGGTDIRVDGNTLYDRVIVAGGGGGSGGTQGEKWGGGTTAGNGYSSNGSGLTPATTSTWGVNLGRSQANGSFGVGGSIDNYTNSIDSGGGGGGWFGGAAASATGRGDGGGGSGYVLTSTSYKPSGYTPTSNYWMTNAQTIAGNQTFKSPTGVNETGHTGNGYARITFQGVPAIESSPVTVNNEIFAANLNITDISQSGTSVNITWSIDSNYENVSYKISDSVTQEVYETSESSYTFQNLSRGQHTFTVKAFNESNQQIAEATNDFNVNVRPGVPTVEISQVGNNQAKLNWSVSDDGGSPITGYEYKVDHSDPVSINSSENFKNINLSTGTHEIEFVAKNLIGSSDVATASITIKQLPSQVQNLQVVKSSKTVTVSWTPPMGYSNGETGQGFMSSRSAFVTESGENGGIEYIVESIPAGYTQTTDGTSVTFDLDEGDNTDYQFKVTPIMPFGEGIPNYTGLMSSSNNMGEVNIFVESTISLTLNDDTVDLSEIPGSTDVVTDDNEMDYTVTTNNLEGYTVTVKADQPNLDSATVGNTDNIPVDLITVAQSDSDNGMGSNAAALSSTNDNELYSQNQRSVESGDSFTSTFNLTEVPWVNADNYTGTVTYTATAN